MNRDDLILSAAERLFHERSFSAVGVDEIAREAGITGGAIYRHFRSKDEILAALFIQAADEMLLRLGAALDDPREELRHLVSVHVGFARDHQRLTGIYTREERSLSPASRRRYHRSQAGYVDRWRQCVSALLPDYGDDDITTVVRALTALLAAEATRMPGSRSSERASEILYDMAVGAMEQLTAGAPRDR